MFRTILTYGAIAGLIAGGGLSTVIALGLGEHGATGMAIGYLIMLIAFATIPVAIKRWRDREGGGVIRFWPAFALGLGISAVAAIFYVAAWEAAQALTGMDFASDYSRSAIATERARGATAAEIAALERDMASFRASYADPLFRLPMTFAEIFPVGALASLVSAALLRNPRIFPARRAVQPAA